MRTHLVALAVGSLLISASAQTSSAQNGPGPNDSKAQKTYAEGLNALRIHRYFDALSKFKKAEQRGRRPLHRVRGTGTEDRD